MTTNKLTISNSPEVSLINDQPVTTSRSIATYFHKQHKNILASIRRLNCSDEFRYANFSAHPYKDIQNNEIYEEYQLTKDGFIFLVMGFGGKRAAEFKEAYITEFNRMEEQLKIQQDAKSNKLYLSRMRFLVTVEAGKEEKAMVVQPDEFVCSYENFPKMIDQAMFVYPDELMAIANACNTRLVKMAKGGLRPERFR